MCVCVVVFYYIPQFLNTAPALYWQVEEDPERVDGWLLKAPLATKTVSDPPQS